MKQVGPTNYISFTANTIGSGGFGAVAIRVARTLKFPYTTDQYVDPFDITIDWGYQNTISTYNISAPNTIISQAALPEIWYPEGIYTIKIYSPDLGKMGLFGTNSQNNFSLWSNLNILSFYGLNEIDFSQGGISISSLNLTYHPNLIYLDIRNNPVSALSDLRNNPMLNYADFTNCNLSVSQVNNILVQVDQTNAAVYDWTYNISPKTLLLAGINDPPTGAGLTAKTSLEGKGWSVSIN